MFATRFILHFACTWPRLARPTRHFCASRSGWKRCSAHLARLHHMVLEPRTPTRSPERRCGRSRAPLPERRPAEELRDGRRSPLDARATAHGATTTSASRWGTRPELLIGSPKSARAERAGKTNSPCCVLAPSLRRMNCCTPRESPTWFGQDRARQTPALRVQNDLTHFTDGQVEVLRSARWERRHAAPHRRCSLCPRPWDV